MKLFMVWVYTTVIGKRVCSSNLVSDVYLFTNLEFYFTSSLYSINVILRSHNAVTYSQAGWEVYITSKQVNYCFQLVCKLYLMFCPGHPLMPWNMGTIYNCLANAQYSIMGQRPDWKELDQIAWLKLSMEATQTSIIVPTIIWWTATAPDSVQPKCSQRKSLTYCRRRSQLHQQLFCRRSLRLHGRKTTFTISALILFWFLRTVKCPVPFFCCHYCLNFHYMRHT